jgi:hypothetical protein
VTVILFGQKQLRLKMEDIWFDTAAVGKNTLGDKMKILSLKTKGNNNNNT